MTAAVALRAPHWLGGGAASLTLHIAVLAALALVVAPDPPDRQPMPEARLNITGYEVERSTAQPEAAGGDAVTGHRADGALATEAAVPVSQARPVAPDASRAAAAALAAEPVRQAESGGTVAAPAAMTAAPVAATAPRATPVSAAAAAPDPVATIAAAPQTVPARESETAASPVASVAAAAQPVQVIAAVSAERVPALAGAAGAVPLSAATMAASPLTTVAGASETVRVNTAAGAERVAALAASAEAVAPSTANTVTLREADSAVDVAAIAGTAPETTPASALAAAANRVPTVAAEAEIVSARLADAPPPSAALALADTAEPAALVATPGDSLARMPATGVALPDRSANAARPAASLAPPAERTTAELAWSGAGAVVDPVSLAAIQAFMQPGDTGASGASLQLRDGIAALLAAIPCARLQTRFVPETGTLELRGHIPDEGLRAPVLQALQAQMGAAIPLSDQVLILPRPQCGALAGIADVGLPQSTDQLTDPRIIGADAHVRDYRYVAGQRLTFDLTAPDYDSVIYVDYFDAEGMVIHLQPNDVVPLAPTPAAATVTVGQDQPGQTALNITIGPPFGQEITVAFAASVPLYAGVRPIREPAEPYLAFLRTQVAAARAAHADFKGEWVYFFITTTAE